MSFEELKERFGVGKKGSEGEFGAEFGPGGEIKSSPHYSNPPDMGGEGM